MPQSTLGARMPRGTLATLVACSLAACAATAPNGPGRESGDPQSKWTDTRIPPGAKIALAVGRFDPPRSVEGEARTGQFAAKGALHGAAACGAFLSNVDAVSRTVGAALAIICLPFGAAGGAAWGVANAASQDSVNAAKPRLAAAADGEARYLVPILSARLEAYARDIGLSGPGLLGDQGSKSTGEERRYEGADYVVEITLVDIVATTPGTAKLPYGFSVGVKGRLIRTADHAVIESFTRRFNTNRRTVEQWTQDDNAALRTELTGVMHGAARVFVDEWILVYRGDAAPTPSQGGQDRRNPDYVLHPLEPPVSASLKLFGLLYPGHLTPADVASLNPTLAWERLPRTMPAMLFDGAQPRARKLAYEVVLFDGFVRRGVGPYATPVSSSIRTFMPARPVRSYRNITESRFRIKDPLLPCRHYFWSVRAHFELDGRKRTTEWSGAYRVLMYGEKDPSSIRRDGPRAGSAFSTGTFPDYGYFYPFRTPSADGSACSKVD